MALTADEFLALQRSPTTREQEARCACGEPLGPRVDGERHILGDKEVCDDCYFEAWGEEIDRHPIIPPKGPRA